MAVSLSELSVLAGHDTPEDRNGMQGKLVGRSEDSDWDFSTVGHEKLLHRHDSAVCADSLVNAIAEGMMALVKHLSIRIDMSHALDICHCVFDGDGRMRR